MAIKLVLSSEEIGNKVFKGVPRGYDPYEVDKFLDSIISDYEKVETNYLASQEEMDTLNKRIKKLTKTEPKNSVPSFFVASDLVTASNYV